MMTLVQTLVAWLGVFVAVAGVALCVPHLSRSKWVTLLAGAFAVEAAVLFFYRLSAALLRNSVFSADSMTLVLLAASVVLLLARAALVAGVMGLVSELSRPAKAPGSEYFGG